MNPSEFVRELSALRFPDTFNPYSDCCQIHDQRDAPSRRASTLAGLLARASNVDIDAIWIGRDLGYRGGRRTGLALTDDVHIDAHADRWEMKIDRPTRGAPVAERTAAVVWRVLRQVNSHVFLWNVFPLHPHESSSPFTNRAHSRSERQAGEEILAQLIALLRPRRIIAVGNDAAAAAERLSGLRPIVPVRHPSYGGQTIFSKQISALYDLRPSEPLLL